MTGVWSRPPVGRVVKLAELGALGENLGEHNGESRRVCLLQNYPGWIFKQYRAPVAADGVQRLNRLIRSPAQMTAADKVLVDAHTSWPTTRVVDGRQQTIGVLIPLAPAIFSTVWQKPSGRSERKTLEVDVLALTEAHQTRIKLPPQSLNNRISICASIAAVGALLERQGLVYLDWSYTNVFWSLLDHTAYVIDLDGCSFGPRPQIQSPNWDDPLVPRGRRAGNESDRYRLALLTARCLTGMRAGPAEPLPVLNSLQRRGGATGEVAQILALAIAAQSTAERPSMTQLSAALQAAKRLAAGPGLPGSVPGAGGVRQWKQVGVRGSPPQKVTPSAAPPRAAPTRLAGSYPLGSPPVRKSNVPAPSQPSSGAGVVITVMIAAILIIVLLIIIL